MRKKLGMTQEELGEAVGVTNAVIGKWERGDSSPTPEALAWLADTLLVTIDDLVLANKETGETLHLTPKYQNPPEEIVSLLARLNRQLDEAEELIKVSKEPHIAKRLIEIKKRIRDRFPDQADEILGDN
ncbi:MAG: helix-turn-helix transcriptional regulator [Bacteroidota bacterium]